MRLTEWIGLCIFIAVIVMCSTGSNKSKALFVKICEIESGNEVACQVYFFEKLDTSLLVNHKTLLDSVLSNDRQNFVGKNAANLPYLHYIQSDTINFFIYRDKK